MPKWGIEMTEGTLSEWNIQEGERVTKGQVVAQVETDKIVNEIQSEFDTVFVRLLAKPGDVHAVGTLLAVMAAESVPAAAIDEFVRTYRGGFAGNAGAMDAPSAAPGADAPEASADADTDTDADAHADADA